ncbi:MAG TPA: carbonic anhydrase [Arcobacter sp.]|nr:carbonic anhydrase [Arcobacter sp.]HIP55726.1 carbonic anhydrase [Arcobacter sp.]
MNIKKLIKGNKRFREAKFTQYKDDFKTLVEHGQKPNILFIGCSDSRVVPDLIVDSKPGDMFLMRNIGNFVPPFKDDFDFHGVSAVIEYAVSVLKVKDIIVCGHTHCGACASLYEDLSTNKKLIHVRKWLELGQKAKEYALLNLLNKKSSKEQLLRTTEKISVAYQLENLLTYPEVAKRIKKGKLNIHGWFYDIEDGSIEVYNPKKAKYKKLK